MLADNGQYGLIPDGITHAGILPGILLEKDEYNYVAFGIADVRTAFQKISRRAVWELPLGSALRLTGQPVQTKAET
jgi:hypothetical protein